MNTASDNTNTTSGTTVNPDEKFSDVMSNHASVLGRPVDPTSKRQVELREKGERNSEGKLGRPVDPTSKRQLELAAKGDNPGTGKKGRPVDPNSPRQLQLAEKEERKAKREAAWAAIKAGETQVDVSVPTADEVKDEVVEPIVEEVELNTTGKKASKKH